MAQLPEIEDLRIHFHGPHGVVKAVDGISYAVDAGETVPLVGKSDRGKSMSALAVLGLVPRPAGWSGGTPGSNAPQGQARAFDAVHPAPGGSCLGNALATAGF